MNDSSETEGVVFEAVTSLEGKVLGDILEGIKPTVKEKHNSPDIIADAVKPDVAFEVFAGRRYWGKSSDDRSDSVANLKQQISERVLSQQRTMASGLSRVETPMEKYQRLRAELTEFSNDIKALDAIKKNGAKTETGEPLVDPVLPKMKEGITELMQQLALIEGNPSLGPLLLANSDLAIQSISAQDHLTAKITETMEQMKINGDSKPRIVRNDAKAAENNTSTLSMDVEARVTRLESVLGRGASDSSTLYDPFHGENTNLMAVVNGLEEKMKMLEPGRLESIHRRAKILSSELDAIGKKMKRYGSGLKAGETEQEKSKILLMFDKMVKWDSVCNELPLLVDRLRSANEIHKGAVEFDERISRMESIQETLSKKLEVDEEVVQNLEKSLIENAQLMEKNTKLLDQRFQDLAKRL